MNINNNVRPMRSHSTLFSEFSGEFNMNLLRWITSNTERIEKSFSKKYPNARNRFNVHVPNTNGSKKTLALNSRGNEKLGSSQAYVNSLPWATLRRLGCPEA